jgi:hypothetical protein
MRMNDLQRGIGALMIGIMQSKPIGLFVLEAAL